MERVYSPPTDSQLARILRENTTIAVVGLSDNPARPSYGVARYLQQAGYRIIPVNPPGHGVGGEGLSDLGAIPGPIEVVNVFRRSEHVPGLCGRPAKGAAVLWLQEGPTRRRPGRPWLPGWKWSWTAAWPVNTGACWGLGSPGKIREVMAEWSVPLKKKPGPRFINPPAADRGPARGIQRMVARRRLHQDHHPAHRPPGGREQGEQGGLSNYLECRWLKKLPGGDYREAVRRFRNLHLRQNEDAGRDAGENAIVGTGKMGSLLAERLAGPGRKYSSLAGSPSKPTRRPGRRAAGPGLWKWRPGPPW